MFDVEDLKKIYRTNMNCDLSRYGVNINDVDENGATYLHYACRETDLDISYIIWLISKNININTFDKYDISPLYIALRNGNENLADLLIDNGADVDAVSPHGFTALYMACYHDDAHVINLLSERYHANIEVPNRRMPVSMPLGSNNENVEDDFSLLELACSNNHETAARNLIKLDADVNYSSSLGFTPLYIACDRGNDAIIGMLSSEHVNPNAIVSSPKTITVEGEAILSELFVDFFPDYTLLALACSNNHETVAKKLIELGADVNRSNCFNYNYPLHIACFKHNPNLVKLLLENGARINTVSSSQIMANGNSTRINTLDIINYYKNNNIATHADNLIENLILNKRDELFKDSIDNLSTDSDILSTDGNTPPTTSLPFCDESTSTKNVLDNENSMSFDQDSLLSASTGTVRASDCDKNVDSTTRSLSSVVQASVSSYENSEETPSLISKELKNSYQKSVSSNSNEVLSYQSSSYHEPTLIISDSDDLSNNYPEIVTDVTTPSRVVIVNYNDITTPSNNYSPIYKNTAGSNDTFYRFSTPTDFSDEIIYDLDTSSNSSLFSGIDEIHSSCTTPSLKIQKILSFDETMTRDINSNYYSRHLSDGESRKIEHLPLKKTKRDIDQISNEKTLTKRKKLNDSHQIPNEQTQTLKKDKEPADDRFI